MNELKPVAIVQNCFDEFGRRERISFLGPVKEGTKLYAIPDTHRVVSVELLQSYQAAIEAGQFMGFDDEYEQMQAIIDNKEQKE